MLPALIVFVLDTLTLIAIYLIVSISLNIEYGYTGIADFGKAGAVAIGAYSIGAIPGRLLMYLLAIKGDYIMDNTKVVATINKFLQKNIAIAAAMLLLSLIVAGGLGTVFGFLASYPVARLKGEHLAIFMLAMAEAIRYVAYCYAPLVGGPYGVTVPDPFRFLAGSYRIIGISIVIIIISLGTFSYIERLTKSPLGRTLKAIRDCDIAAEVLGKDVAGYRMKIMVLSSATAAVAGALYAFYITYVSGIAYDRVDWTFWPWTIVVLGGMANNWGVALGTVTFIVMRRLIIFYKRGLEPILPFDVVWLEYILLGLTLILILMFKPEGLLPEKPIKTVELNKYKKEKSKSS